MRFLPGVNLGSTEPGPPARRAAVDGRGLPATGSPRWAGWASGWCASTRSTRRRSTPNWCGTTGPTRTARCTWCRASTCRTSPMWTRATCTTRPSRPRSPPNCATPSTRRTADLRRDARRRDGPHGDWTADVSPWLVAWIAGVEWDPYATAATDATATSAAPAVDRPVLPVHSGRLAGRALDRRPARGTGHRAGRRRPLDADRVRELADHRSAAAPGRAAGVTRIWSASTPTTCCRPANWPGGTFASYHAYPYYPDFQRHEPALQRVRPQWTDGPVRRLPGRAAPPPRAGRNAGDGQRVRRAVGARAGALRPARPPPGRAQRGRGDAHRRRAAHADPGRRAGRRASSSAGPTSGSSSPGTPSPTSNRPTGVQLWHDPLTNEQHFGLIATDPTGAVNPDPVRLGDVTARVDEAYLHLRFPADRSADGHDRLRHARRLGGRRPRRARRTRAPRPPSCST